MAERTQKLEIVMNSPNVHIERTKELGYPEVSVNLATASCKRSSPNSGRTALCFSTRILCIGTALHSLWRLGMVNGA